MVKKKSLFLEQQLKQMQREIDSVQLCVNRLREMSFGLQKAWLEINQPQHPTQINRKPFESSAASTRLEILREKTDSSKIRQQWENGKITAVKKTPQSTKLKAIKLKQKKTPSTPYDLYYSKDLLSDERREEDSRMIHFDDHTSHISVLTASEFSLRPGNFLREDDDTTIKTDVGNEFHLSEEYPIYQIDQEHPLNHDAIDGMDPLAPPSSQYSTPQRINKTNMKRSTKSSEDDDVYNVDVNLLDINQSHNSTFSVFDNHSSSSAGKGAHKKSRIRRRITQARKRMGRFFLRK